MQQNQFDMEYRQVGPTSLKVSVVSYGNWLNSNDPATITRNKQIVKHAWDLGINFFDTAEIYGSGEAEVQLGVALQELMAEKKVPREDLVVSTKIFFGTAGSSPYPNCKSLSRKHVIEGLKASLKRLQLSYVDLVFCHRFDSSTPLEETCRAFDWVVRKGWATYWGTSEWSPQEITEAVGICERLGLYKPVVEQPQYNMFVRDRFEVEYERIFSQHKYGTTVWSPLAQGLLTGKYNETLDTEGRLTSMADNPALQNFMKKYFDTEENKQKILNKLKAIGEVAKELGVSQANFALAWVIKNKDVTTAITSASRPEQLDDTVKAIHTIKLITPEVEQKIEAILGNKPVAGSFWGPGKTRRDLYV